MGMWPPLAFRLAEAKTSNVSNKPGLTLENAGGTVVLERIRHQWNWENWRMELWIMAILPSSGVCFCLFWPTILALETAILD